MKKKTSHIMTSGEILSKKKNKTIGILSVVLFISAIFNVYLFTDISISGLDEYIPGKSVVTEEIGDDIENEENDIEIDDYIDDKQAEVSEKVTASDINKFDKSSIKAFEKESGIQLIYEEKPLGQKLYLEAEDAEGSLRFYGLNDICKEFEFSKDGCSAYFSDGTGCSFNFEKVEEFKEIISRFQIYYSSRTYYETDGGKIVEVPIEYFSMYIRSSKGSISGNYFLPYNYDELNDYFERLHQICISE